MPETILKGEIKLTLKYIVPIDTFAINNLVAADCEQNPGTIPLGREVLEIFQGILLFDINPLLALTEVNAAILSMQVQSQLVPGTNKTFGIYKIIQNWLPTPTCPGSPPAFDSTPFATFNVGPGVVDINVDVKSLVEEWIVDDQRNFGMLIKSIDESIDLTAIRIYSIGYSNSTRWPSILLDLSQTPIEITGSLDPVIEFEADIPVITGDSFAYSTPRQFSKAFFSTFFIKNDGLEDAVVKLQISSDDITYIDDSIEITVAAGEEVTLIPQTFGNYMRVAYKSLNLGQPTILSINYIAKLQ